MDGIISNNLKEEKLVDDSINVGDNAMNVDRSASFLMGYDPYKDPEKPRPKSSIGDAPMGEKPTENPLALGHLSLSSRENAGPDTSFGGDTTIAQASNLGPNPLGLNPFGEDFQVPDALTGFASAPAPVKRPEPKPEPVPMLKFEQEPVLKTVPEPMPKPVAAPAPKSVAAPVPKPVAEAVQKPVQKQEKEEVPTASPFGSIVSISERSMIIFASNFFGSEASTEDDADEEDFKPVEEKTNDELAALLSEIGISVDEPVGVKPETSVSEEEPIGLAAEAADTEGEPIGLLSEVSAGDDEPMGLMPDVTIAEEKPLEKVEKPIEEKPKTNVPEGMDPLMALLLAGGNPFGDNAKSSAPDLSFGKEALKPKHFEPMKASGPAVNAENVAANHPLGDNPFGKEVVPDFSMGKEALKPKKYVPKKTFETTGALADDQDEDK